jgi:hypothetical protein
MRLFELDPYASAQYGVYKTLKKEDASFEDFLLRYDSHGVNKGDFSWLEKLGEQGAYASMGLSLFGQSASFLGIGASALFSAKDSLAPALSAYNSDILLMRANQAFSGLYM